MKFPTTAVFGLAALASASPVDLKKPPPNDKPNADLSEWMTVHVDQVNKFAMHTGEHRFCICSKRLLTEQSTSSGTSSMENAADLKTIAITTSISQSYGRFAMVRLQQTHRKQTHFA
jgi:hypothetical protein